MKNLVLKMELWRQDKTTKDLSKETGINRSYLCMYTTGKMNPTEDHKQRIAEVLGRPVKELFG